MAPKRKSQASHEGPGPPPPPPDPAPPPTGANPPSPLPDIHRTVVKGPFDDIFRNDPALRQRLYLYLNRWQSLAEHATHAIKRFVLHSDPIPVLTKEHVEAALYLLNKGEEWRPRSRSKIAIRALMIQPMQEYRDLMDLPFIGLPIDQQPINFLSASIYTNLEVNVQEHFKQMLLRYINLRLGKLTNWISKSCNAFLPLLTKPFLNAIDVRGFMHRHRNNPDLRRLFQQNLRKIKSFCMFETIPSQEELAVLSPLESTLLNEIWTILPSSAIQSSVPYIAASDAMSLFRPYCNLARMFETHGFPLFAAMPLRKSRLQAHATIDSKILCSQTLELPDNDTTRALPKEFYWDQAVNLGHKAFKGHRGMAFEGTLSTNGMDVSVHLVHPNAPRYGTGKRRKRSREAMRAEVDAMYIDHHVDELARANNVVVIDPNRRDLLFLQDRNNHDSLRYTSTQRAVETGSKYYQQQRLFMKRVAGVTMIESSLPSGKTMDPALFDEYLQSRVITGPFLTWFYSNPIHLRWKWKRYMNNQRSEQLFINRMKQAYSKSGPFVVVLGDWSDKGHTPKFQQPTKTRGFMKLFARQHVSSFFKVLHLSPLLTSLHLPFIFHAT